MLGEGFARLRGRSRPRPPGWRGSPRRTARSTLLRPRATRSDRRPGSSRPRCSRGRGSPAGFRYRSDSAARSGSDRGSGCARKAVRAIRRGRRAPGSATGRAGRPPGRATDRPAAAGQAAAHGSALPYAAARPHPGQRPPRRQQPQPRCSRSTRTLGPGASGSAQRRARESPGWARCGGRWGAAGREPGPRPRRRSPRRQWARVGLGQGAVRDRALGVRARDGLRPPAGLTAPAVGRVIRGRFRSAQPTLTAL